jgi:hypothetical protein
VTHALPYYVSELITTTKSFRVPVANDIKPHTVVIYCHYIVILHCVVIVYYKATLVITEERHYITTEIFFVTLANGGKLEYTVIYRRICKYCSKLRRNFYNIGHCLAGNTSVKLPNNY